ncbi:MAG: hypothetical protein EOP85_09165 [Verrucomicrobiaceae bacterium]|nr:MAG: hypothetical protein EOP85_09165 [Verrucomicrobiaceae bacterium]
MKTQPPPHVPAPPCSEAAQLSRQKWNWLMVVGIVSVIACFIWVTRPVVIRSHRNSEHTEALGNARRVGLALFEFEMEYGKFPDETTIEMVERKAPAGMILGNSSANDLLRQLIASGIASDERMFHAKIPGSRKPDGRIAGDEALGKGEVGFSYLAGMSTAGNPSRPVLVTPVIPGTNRFDRDVFDGGAVMLKIDNSAISIRIEKSGHFVKDRKHILDPANPVWGTVEKWKLFWPR